MAVSIAKLKVTNFRSIDSLTLENLPAFAVFAGPNGAGKSNFFDAIHFVKTIVQSGIEVALRQFGGYDNIHSVKRRREYARTFEFYLEASLADEGGPDRYHLKITQLDDSPVIEEEVTLGNGWSITRKKDDSILMRMAGNQEGHRFPSLPSLPSALLLTPPECPLRDFLREIRIFRINPVMAKEPDPSDQDPSDLHSGGHNLATVLGRLEKEDEFREGLMDLVSQFIPGTENIRTLPQRLTTQNVLSFKERGTNKEFPAHLISDGTIYILSLLVAILRRPPHGITLIEEPERGIHPQVILEMVQLMRELATAAAPIWLTTHNETLVRGTRAGDLFLVDKREGVTKVRSASLPKGSGLSMDQAWLANLFGGGLPW